MVSVGHIIQLWTVAGKHGRVSEKARPRSLSVYKSLQTNSDHPENNRIVLRWNPAPKHFFLIIIKRSGT